MKNLLLLTTFLFTSAIAFAQEGVSVEGNSLTITEVPPVWPGCENSSAAERKACFNKQLVNHVVSNFKFPAGYKKGTVKEPVVVQFAINTAGKPEILKVSGGTKALQEEAKRNILAIPTMEPGHAGGQPRAIKYTMPFTF